MTHVLLVISNVPDEQSADTIARQLIQQQAAACVNRLSPCISTYSWNNTLEQEQEIPLLIKTTDSAYPRVQQIIQQYHPYELPEIIAVSVHQGLPGYLDWVNESITDQSPN